MFLGDMSIKGCKNGRLRLSKTLGPSSLEIELTDGRKYELEAVLAARWKCKRAYQAFHALN